MNDTLDTLVECLDSTSITVAVANRNPVFVGEPYVGSVIEHKDVGTPVLTVSDNLPMKENKVHYMLEQRKLFQFLITYLLAVVACCPHPSTFNAI